MNNIEQWREHLLSHAALSVEDVDELESHLRDEIDAMTSAGLDADEAFLIAVKRLGAVDELSREYANAHSERLWKQLFGRRNTPAVAANLHERSFMVAVACASVAALTIVVSNIFGATLEHASDFWIRNLPIVGIGSLAAYFLIVRRAPSSTVLTVVAGFAVIGIPLNAYPFASTGATTFILSLVSAIAGIWLVAGLGYERRVSLNSLMNHIRFSGEWAVYYLLIAIGGGVLTGVTAGVFSVIGIPIDTIATLWIVPMAALGAVVTAAWLVEAKQSVIENIVPVIAMLFTPLVTIVLLAFVVAGLASGRLVHAPRGLLITFDVVLVIVTALLLYSISAAEPLRQASWFDVLQLVMIVAAVLIDLFVLAAMIGRIGEFGASPNKLTSLGTNLILLTNLCGAAFWQLRFIQGHAMHSNRERWQIGFVPVYLAWAAVIVVALPPIFGFE
jgi:hypothetical protein